MLFTKTVIAFLVTGFVLGAIGGGMIPLFKYIFRNKINDQVPLTNNSETFNNWLEPPIPVYFQVYLFNYTNNEAILKNGSTPHVYESGPYTYREEMQKFNVVLENGIVSYREKKYYIFDRQKSVGPESNVIMTPNLPILTVINFVRYTNITVQALVDLLTFQDKAFKTLTVADIVWGYEDPIIANIAKTMNVSLPQKFGIFYGKNGTDDGSYDIYTGTKNVDNLGKIKTWNGASSLPYWNSQYCNMINGSDGTLFPPFLNKDSRIYIFSTDICRSVHTTFDKEMKVRDIKVYRYTPPPDVFRSGNIDPANKGYCTPICLLSGLLNISKCHQDAPIVLSQPHFFQADPAIIKSVVGLKPNKEKHSTQLDIEPNTGLGMHLAKRLQINIMIESVPYITVSKKLNKKVLPILWIDENANIDENSAEKFRNEVQTPLQIMTGVVLGFMSCSILFIVLAILTLIYNKQRNQHQDYEKI